LMLVIWNFSTIYWANSTYL